MGNTMCIWKWVHSEMGTLRYRYRFQIAVPGQYHTLSHSVTGMLVPRYWSGEWSLDIVDQLMTCLILATNPHHCPKHKVSGFLFLI
jgi:hypothetical protein